MQRLLRGRLPGAWQARIPLIGRVDCKVPGLFLKLPAQPAARLLFRFRSCVRRRTLRISAAGGRSAMRAIRSASSCHDLPHFSRRTASAMILSFRSGAERPSRHGGRRLRLRRGCACRLVSTAACGRVRPAARRGFAAAAAGFGARRSAVFSRGISRVVSSPARCGSRCGAGLTTVGASTSDSCSKCRYRRSLDRPAE